jgi:cobalt-zinc-cadmium efflux system protein
MIAAWIAQKPETNTKTYGYYRAEILAAFLQGIILWAVVFYMFFEAVGRLQQLSAVMSLEMLVIAILGLLVNGLFAVILSRSKDQNLNVKGATMHVVSDGICSVGVIAAGVIMFYTGLYQVDALISMLIGALILFSSGKIIRESLNILLEGVPSHMNLDDIEKRILEVKGVREVHDLHVWCTSPTKMCIMSCHVVVEKGVDKKSVTWTLIHVLKEEFGIDHTTIQLEDEGYPKSPGEHS